MIITCLVFLATLTSSATDQQNQEMCLRPFSFGMDSAMVCRLMLSDSLVAIDFITPVKQGFIISFKGLKVGGHRIDTAAGKLNLVDERIQQTLFAFYHGKLCSIGLYHHDPDTFQIVHLYRTLKLLGPSVLPRAEFDRQIFGVTRNYPDAYRMLGHSMWFYTYWGKETDKYTVLLECGRVPLNVRMVFQETKTARSLSLAQR